MLVIQIVNGLMEGMMLFLIASGLTLIFGVSRIVNFAHGSFFMLGAFVVYELLPVFMDGSVTGFALAVLAGGVLVAALGALFEMLVLRRIYDRDQLLQLIITVALVLVLRDLAKTAWGLNDVVVAMPEALSGAVVLWGSYLPVYQLVVFGVGLFVLGVMLAVMRLTRAGILLRAATDDRGMVGLLGTDQRIVFTAVFTAGAFLAGIAGGLAAPFGNVNYLMDTTVIVTAFIVVVIGGLGNLTGALVAALGVGVLKAVGVVYFPRLAMVMIFLVMAVVLIKRSLRARGA